MTIVTKTKTFQAHKLILSARSKVIQKMLITSMMMEASDSLEILDFEETTVEGMLEYIYTDQVVNLEDQAQSLLKIADKFKLPGLKASAEDPIVESLCVENAGDVLALADLTNGSFLKSHAIQFIHR
jgi:speckle-type POZ protein